MSREGWSRLAVGDIGRRGGWRFVLRSSDWALVHAALALRFDARSGPQDAPAERVPARFLGRLDGQDGTPSSGLWGRLALEVVGRRLPDRVADTMSLRWYASWGRGGLAAGSGGRAQGSGTTETLVDLRQQRIRVGDSPFRVRTLPDWEREQAAYDLGLSPRVLLAWAVTPVSVLLRFFDGITPTPLPDDGKRQGPQDAR